MRTSRNSEDYVLMKAKQRLAAVIMLLLFSVLLIGCGKTAQREEVSQKPATRIVEVSNVDELLSAIAPDTEIHMAPGVFNLTESKEYGKKSGNEYIIWNCLSSDGEYELEIRGIQNLKISGASTEIVTVPRCVNVLKFSECGNITLDTLAVGHAEESEACEGGVVYLDHCTSVTIADCSLYGCGTVGVQGISSSGVSITGTCIHDCSTSGVYFSQCKDIEIQNGSIRECGENEIYSYASCLIGLSETDQVRISGCEICDNYASGLLSVSSCENTTVDSLKIRDNHFTSLLDGAGTADLLNLTIANNVIDRWFSDFFSNPEGSAFTMDGKAVTDLLLNERYGQQLSASGVGLAQTDYCTIDRSGAKEIHVSTPDQFLAAIAPDTTIIIDVPQINLTKASDYGLNAVEEFLEPVFTDSYRRWRTVYDGYELCIGNLRNFHIQGGEIVTEPRYANVLNYYNCTGISLDTVSLGHTPEPGVCMGGVLYIKDTGNTILESCDLYGCGILGIQSENCINMQVQNTLIHDCSYGAVVLRDTANAAFLGCSVINCPEPHFTLETCENCSWENKLMDLNCSFNVE